jgi:hypothetical protein
MGMVRKPENIYLDNDYHELKRGFYGDELSSMLYFTGKYTPEGNPIFESERLTECFEEWQWKERNLRRIDDKRVHEILKIWKRDANWLEEKLKEME